MPIYEITANSKNCNCQNHNQPKVVFSTSCTDENEAFKLATSDTRVMHEIFYGMLDTAIASWKESLSEQQRKFYRNKREFEFYADSILHYVRNVASFEEFKSILEDRSNFVRFTYTWTKKDE